MSTFQRKQAGKMAQSLVDVIGRSSLFKRYKKLFIDTLKGEDYTPGEKQTMAMDVTKKIMAEKELKAIIGGTTVGGTVSAVVTKKLLSDVNKNNNKTKLTPNTKKKYKSAGDKTHLRVKEKERLRKKALDEKQRKRKQAAKNKIKQADKLEKLISKKIRPQTRRWKLTDVRPQRRPLYVTKNNKK